MTLRARFSLTIATLVALAVAIASTFAWLSTRSELYDEVDAALITRVEPVQAAVGPRPAGRRPPVDLGRRGLIGSPDTVIVVIDRRGQVIASSEGDPSLPIDDEVRELAAAGERAPIALVDVTLDGQAWRMAVAPIPDGGAVLAARDLSEVEQVLEGLRTRLLLVGALSTALAAGAGWILSRRETAPLEQLTEVAEHVAATRDLTTSIKVHGHDEVGRLAASFDTMLEALATSLDQQQRLIQDAGHELRTPLTSLRTNIDVLGQLDELTTDDREKLLGDLRAEQGELTTIVGELVALAADPVAGGGTHGPVRLDEVVRGSVDTLRRRSGREVDIDASPTTVRGDAALLDRAVTNLLSNADKFAPSGTRIEVVVAEGKVEVRDHGPGIAPADLPHVFDRFYRADSARSAPGSGLGLAIVRQLVEAHGGTVRAVEASGGGATVGFTLPVI